VEGNAIRTSGTPSLTSAHDIANNKQAVWRLLASAIPARSFAVAANPLDDFVIDNRNFNMQTLRGANFSWPTERVKGEERDHDWLHSDIKNLALPYVYNTYQQMLSTANLVEK
jgi:hypothetical protein